MLDAWNDLCAVVHARTKDIPGKVWWNATAGHPAIFRVMRVDPAEFGAFFACLPFRLARIDGEAVVLAAHPCPLTLGPVSDDWLDIETVLAWNPKSGAVRVLGDDAPQIAGRLTDETPTLYGDAFSFFRAWLEARAAFAMLRSQTASKEWAAKPTEFGTAPGALIVGDPDKVRWVPYALPRDIQCVGIDATKINRAIMRAARLPRAVTVPSNLRAAA